MEVEFDMMYTQVAIKNGNGTSSSSVTLNGAKGVLHTIINLILVKKKKGQTNYGS